MLSKCLLGAAAAAACALVLGRVAPPAAADSGCPQAAASTTAFRAWSDATSYFLAGSFEPGTPSWTLADGAAVIRDNEPWYLAGLGAHALQLPAGASATSSCQKAPHDRAVVRFFAHASDAPGAVHVEVLVGDDVADAGVVDVPQGGWTPVAQAVADWPTNSNGAVKLQVRLTSVGGGTVEVDDVFVDPFVSR
jgi:hypothetical protein